MNISFPNFDDGSVWLVGAGPGDPKLLTLYAWHAIQKADIIVHDALVADEILALAPETAVLESMGKRGGVKSSPKQTDISLRLIELAKTGKKILRLKGGDPFVFGRGAEEAKMLIEHGVPVRIVPGVTAGVAGSAYAGVPVSDGASNQVISFVTGHDKSGNVPAVDWQALAKSSPVIVFYMPMKHIAKIQSEMLKAGRDPKEQICVVSNATTPKQKRCLTTLENCFEELAKSDIKSPALLILGPTVGLEADLLECFN
ncbi:uroporphyrinogen-III C-methyltransferase [Terasakiella sp. A23]|uniref:uroporphyrinogen-III C-methyltransferase n=1 Tax=Terasakiella sp. FCG-A23 TaxID=3080561 RepID=UPI002952CE87|nr:uroporphyrinogen-III C-methyltransferase [Terasakiella sp. A23]MDV7338426.1 uroporphyrinogen-III C-methyltransferase [Terasakiella sp. A23]